jgi:hypothetical protein
MTRRPLSPPEQRTLDLIANRAASRFGYSRPGLRGLLLVYITAIHTGPDGPLDLDRLLSAPPATFLHDISGIMMHVDPSTGSVRDCFIPRTQRQSATMALAAMAGLSELPEGQGDDL